MKCTTRFIALVLTLILALSCSMQIFAEEIQRVPSEPLLPEFSTEPCSHNLFSSVPQNHNHEERIPGYPKCMTQVRTYDTNTCVVCNHVWYTNGTLDHYEFHHIKAANGKCIYCFLDVK